jgi:integrase
MPKMTMDARKATEDTGGVLDSTSKRVKEPDAAGMGRFGIAVDCQGEMRVNTGMIKTEIYNLEWVNVNLEHNFIAVTAQEAKNKKIRRIPINRSLRELSLKLNLTRNGYRYEFENPKTGKPYIDLKRGWQSVLERAGINDMRFHDPRHTFASHFLMNGGDLYP